MAASDNCITALKRFLPPIRKDDRYVHLHITECALYLALEDPAGPAVVLFHGGIGQGKSTVARNTALHYKRAEDGNAVFGQVVYLECGPKADAPAKQVKLLHILAPHAIAGQTKEYSDSSDELNKMLRKEKVLLILDDVCEAEFLQIMVDSFGRRVKYLVTSQLGNLCRGSSFSSINIRIEDIRPRDARKIFASHVGLPNQRIPPHLKKTLNKMIRVTEANPLALASIATAIRNGSEKLVEWKTASNGLLQLLHSEDTALILSRKHPSSFWSAMRLSLSSLKEDEKKFLILIHMCKGPSVLEEVIRILYRKANFGGNWATFEKLRDELESRELLKITPHSDDRPTKERLWSVHSLQRQFVDVEMRGASESTFAALEAPSPGISDLCLDCCGGEQAMVMVMGALYYVDHFAERVASRMGIPFDRFSDSRRNAIEPITLLVGQFVDQNWTEILCSSTRRVFSAYICFGVLEGESICHLLASRISTIAMLHALRRIATIEKEALFNESAEGLMNAISLLLGDVDGANANADVREAAGRALCGLCLNHQHAAVMVSEASSVLETAVRVLSSDPDSRMKALSCSILLNLSISQTFVQFPGVLMWLVISLSTEDNPCLNTDAAGTLANLAGLDGETKLKIYDYPKAIEELVKSLSRDGNPDLQDKAAMALANLTAGDHAHIELKVLGCPGEVEFVKLVEELVKLLSKYNSHNLQCHAARALANLAAADDKDIKLIILNSPGILEELVRLLSKGNGHALQRHAARALQNLADGDDIDIKSRIVTSSGAVEKLVKLLSKGIIPDLQEQAACTLAQLAVGNHPDNFFVKFKIARTPGAVEKLVKLLSKDNRHELQRQAASALGNLADAHYSFVNSEIVNFPGALEELVKLLSKGIIPDLQEQVAWTLARLAGGNDRDVKLRIVETPKAVERLVKLLSKDSRHDLQCQAALALGSLADRDRSFAILKRANSLALGEPVTPLSKDSYVRALAYVASTSYDDIQLKIASSPGALKELVRALSKDDNPDLQGKAGRALANLAGGNDRDVKLKIVKSAAALVELVKSLSNDSNPYLQEEAARTLANLATGDHRDIKLTIVDSPGALEELVKSLTKADNSNVQEEAARALANLAAGSDGDVKLRIVNCPGALNQLVRSLSRASNPSLQQAAAEVMYNLTQWMNTKGEVDDTKTTIIGTAGLMDALVSLLNQNVPPITQGWAAGASTMLYMYTRQGNEPRLYSSTAYWRRGCANMTLGLLEEAVADLDKACKIQPRNLFILRSRWKARAMIGDLQGALADANETIDIKRTPVGLQERGNLKSMMGDLPGALEDLKESLDLKTDDCEQHKHSEYEDYESTLRVKRRRFNESLVDFTGTNEYSELSS